MGIKVINKGKRVKTPKMIIKRKKGVKNKHEWIKSHLSQYNLFLIVNIICNISIILLL